MTKASSVEINRRIEELVPLLTDGLTLREIRAYTQAKTDWGQLISEVQLKRYLRRARAEMRSTDIDATYELRAAKLRCERTLARSAAKGDLLTYLRATKELARLLSLSLAAEQPEGIDINATRHQLEEEIADEIARRNSNP